MSSGGSGLYIPGMAPIFAETSFVAGDSSAILQVQCNSLPPDSGTGTPSVPEPINLTGMTVNMRFVIGQSATAAPQKGAKTKPMVIVNDDEGIVQYNFQSSDLVPGWMWVEIQITNSNNTVLTSVNVGRFLVRPLL